MHYCNLLVFQQVASRCLLSHRPVTLPVPALPQLEQLLFAACSLCSVILWLIFFRMLTFRVVSDLLALAGCCWARARTSPYTQSSSYNCSLTSIILIWLFARFFFDSIMLVWRAFPAASMHIVSLSICAILGNAKSRTKLGRAPFYIYMLSYLSLNLLAIFLCEIYFRFSKFRRNSHEVPLQASIGPVSWSCREIPCRFFTFFIQFIS